MATTLKPTNKGIADGASRLLSGGLVAFPTETVYGLGANALNEKAVLNIFTVKGRPLTDPLIVHCASAEDAAALVLLDDKDGGSIESREEWGLERRAFHALSEAFWPGGLTIVALAKPHLPLCLSAGTGRVGVRVPSHPLARRLIREAGCPVAAPSANRFGHVSPTTATHVLEDLGHADIAVLDGDAPSEKGTGDEWVGHDATCEHGIESTVCKIDAPAGELVVFRRGATSEGQLLDALNAAGLASELRVRVIKKLVPMPEPSPADARGLVGDDGTAIDRGAKRQRLKESHSTDANQVMVGKNSNHGTKSAENDELDSIKTIPIPRKGAGEMLLMRQVTETGNPEEWAGEKRAVEQPEEEPIQGEEAPGQLITHYAPDIPTYILRVVDDDGGGGGGGTGGYSNDMSTASSRSPPVYAEAMSDTIIVDFNGSLQWLSSSAMAYRDLSASGDAKEAARCVFAALRWTETCTRCPTTASASDPGIEAKEAAAASAGAKRVFVADIQSVVDRYSASMAESPTNADHAASVADRLFRAASGRVVDVRRGQLPSDTSLMPLTANGP